MDIPPIWGNLRQPQDWANALRDLLANATAAIALGNVQRQEAAKLLQTFTDKSPFSARELNLIAYDAITDLNIANITDAIKALQQRNEALQRQIDTINSITIKANADAVALRLDTVNKLLSKAKAGLADLQAANNALGKPNDALTKKIDALVEALNPSNA